MAGTRSLSIQLVQLPRKVSMSANANAHSKGHARRRTVAGVNCCGKATASRGRQNRKDEVKMPDGITCRFYCGSA